MGNYLYSWREDSSAIPGLFYVNQCVELHLAHQYVNPLES